MLVGWFEWHLEQSKHSSGEQIMSSSCVPAQPWFLAEGSKQNRLSPALSSVGGGWEDTVT